MNKKNLVYVTPVQFYLYPKHKRMVKELTRELGFKSQSEFIRWLIETKHREVFGIDRQ